ncbi:MAG: helix-turn-helix domain-containing protein [Eggerthellaceae bacterium]|nr:helix-turn-helix domain-containing protein [Eggerthellaceae bacterium]
MIQMGHATIEQARLIASSYLDHKTVYAGRANNYFEADDDDTLIVHRQDMILVRGVDTENVFNEICSIMESYNRWESDIAQLAENEGGLQLMLDASKNVLKAPCYVYAPDGRAFAVASGYSSDIHWHWAEILEDKGITSSRIRSLRDSINLPEVWKDTFPRTRDSQMGDHQYMHCSLYPNGYMAGHFVLFSFSRPFDKGLERIANILVKHMTRHMEAYYAHYSPTSMLAESFSRFFARNSFDEPEIALSLRALRWQLEDEFRIYVIRERSRQDPVLLSRLYNVVTSQFLFVIAFLFGNSLVVVENESRHSSSGLFDRMESLVQDDFCCGVSVLFDDLRQFHTYYLQAKNEAEWCLESGGGVSRAQERGLDQIYGTLRKDQLLWTYAACEIDRLERYDKENGTSYYQTLKAYVLSCFHLSEAARYLGIHRNSLAYRLEKMREVSDLALVDEAATLHDPEAMNYLLLSFAIHDARLLPGE